MKTVEELKVGDTCYWFSSYGEFEGEVTVDSIEVDECPYLDKGYYIKIKHQGTISVREDVTYGDSIDFPMMMCFFSKEAAVKYFLNKIEERVSTLKNSTENLY